MKKKVIDWQKFGSATKTYMDWAASFVEANELSLDDFAAMNIAVYIYIVGGFVKDKKKIIPVAKNLMKFCLKEIEEYAKEKA